MPMEWRQNDEHLNGLWLSLSNPHAKQAFEMVDDRFKISMTNDINVWRDMCPVLMVSGMFLIHRRFN